MAIARLHTPPYDLIAPTYTGPTGIATNPSHVFFPSRRDLTGNTFLPAPSLPAWSEPPCRFTGTCWLLCCVVLVRRREGTHKLLTPLQPELVAHWHYCTHTHTRERQTERESVKQRERARARARTLYPSTLSLSRARGTLALLSYTHTPDTRERQTERESVKQRERARARARTLYPSTLSLSRALSPSDEKREGESL
jgi:hypothetical protein